MATVFPDSYDVLSPIEIDSLISVSDITDNPSLTTSQQSTHGMGNPLSKKCGANKRKDAEIHTQVKQKDGENVVEERDDDMFSSLVLNTGSNGIVQAPVTQSSLGQKRKTEEVFCITDDSHNISLHLYQLTLSKLLSSPQRRVEPPLQRSVVMRNTLKQLEFGIFSHSPSKRIYLDLDESTALNNLHLSPQSSVGSQTSLVTTEPLSDPVDMPQLATQSPTSTAVISCAMSTTSAAISSTISGTLSGAESIATSSKESAIHEGFNFGDLLQPDVTCALTSMDSSTNQEQVINSQSDTMDVTPSFFTTAQACSAESLEKMKYTPLSDLEFQSLMNCSLDQYSLRDAQQGNRASNQSHDELDNIMQVLVGM